MFNEGSEIKLQVQVSSDNQSPSKVPVSYSVNRVLNGLADHSSLRFSTSTSSPFPIILPPILWKKRTSLRYVLKDSSTVRYVL